MSALPGKYQGPKLLRGRICVPNMRPCYVPDGVSFPLADQNAQKKFATSVMAVVGSIGAVWKRLQRHCRDLCGMTRDHPFSNTHQTNSHLAILVPSTPKSHSGESFEGISPGGASAGLTFDNQT
jgi:hypothetical protein